MAMINSDTIAVETKTCGFVTILCCFETLPGCFKNNLFGFKSKVYGFKTKFGSLCSVESNYWEHKRVSKLRYVLLKLNTIVYLVLKMNAWSQNSLVTAIYFVWKH